MRGAALLFVPHVALTPRPSGLLLRGRSALSHRRPSAKPDARCTGSQRRRVCVAADGAERGERPLVGGPALSPPVLAAEFICTFIFAHLNVVNSAGAFGSAASAASNAAIIAAVATAGMMVSGGRLAGFPPRLVPPATPHLLFPPR
jgi:hypothetical protein